MLYLQLEIGTFTQIMSLPYDCYGTLPTKSLNKCIWAETEPYGITFRTHYDSIWTPRPQEQADIPIMEMATLHFKECTMINRCLLYLQLISLFDLITYDGKQIYPNIKNGKRVQSRRSTIFWINF